jgi:iron-sulfur cluster insertion protein
MTDTNNTSINLSINAADKIASLIEEAENPNLNLRVYITGGGCSGFQYGITFDEVINSDDTIITKQCSDEKTSVNLVIDSMSYPYLDGAEVDYTSGIEEQFIINNPNAKTTCGCGSSFSIDDEE